MLVFFLVFFLNREELKLLAGGRIELENDQV